MRTLASTRLPLYQATSHLKDWIAAATSDPATMVCLSVAIVGLLLLVLAVLVAVFLVLARRQAPQMAAEPAAPAADEAAFTRWVGEGRHLFAEWQERIERLNELQVRLAAMTDEIGRLRAEVSRMDELRAETFRLTQETGALAAERDQLQGVLVRIGELIRRASEARPGAADAAPGVGP